MQPATQFLLRQATAMDIPVLRSLIALSVRELQKDDYSSAQIDGALGHALGLDTQLIEDGTYFVAEAVEQGGSEAVMQGGLEPVAQGGSEAVTQGGAEPVAQGGSIVGCGGWSNRKTLFGSDHGPNRVPALLDPATDAAKIRAIFVHPRWARKGLGTLILKHCEEAAQRAGFSTLEMGSTLTGVPLYALRGYVARERVAVPLPNGETLPIVHMVKVL
jgi:GNAT superfamily N-acetyltransferase